MSRLLNAINKRLGEEITQNDWFRDTSRLVVYFAQKGDAADAARELLQLRAVLCANSSAHGIVYVNLAEATVCFQAGSTVDAIKKARRAYAISKAVCDVALISQSSAWLSHLYFNSGQYMESIEAARESMSGIGVCEKSGIARVSLAIADMYHFFGDYVSAKKWYHTARGAASDEGDEVMIGIILYNVATYRLNCARLSELQVDCTLFDGFRLKLEVASSSNYDFGVQSSAFPFLLPLLNAQAFTLDSKFSEAAEIFERYFTKEYPEDMVRLYSSLRADYSWCLANLGRHSEALKEISQVVAELSLCVAPDDRALALYRAGLTYRLLGDVKQAHVYQSQMQLALAEHRAIQDKVLEKLNSQPWI